MTAPRYTKRSLCSTQERVRTLQRNANDRIGSDLRKFAAHYFTVYRIGLDMCARCGKPRAEHPRRVVTRTTNP